MEVHYDEQVDAAYIQLSSKQPQGAIEIDEGIIVHLTEANEIVSIEILEASHRFPLNNLFTLKVATAS